MTDTEPRTLDHINLTPSCAAATFEDSMDGNDPERVSSWTRVRHYISDHTNLLDGSIDIAPGMGAEQYLRTYKTDEDFIAAGIPEAWVSTVRSLITPSPLACPHCGQPQRQHYTDETLPLV